MKIKSFAKKLIKKLPLFFVFFAVVGYALFEYRKSLKEEGKEGIALFKGTIEDATQIQLSNPSSSLLIAKKKGDWFLEKPLEDFVDFPELSSWFDTLQNHKLKLISEKPNIKWEDYHLKDASKVEIHFSSGDSIVFSVSKKPSFDGKWFVKKGESLFLGDTDLGKEVNEKTVDSYRSKKLLHSFGHPTKIQFQKKEWKRPLKFSWEKSTWTYLNQKTFPLNSTNMNMFWTELSSLKGERIVGEATPSNLKKWGLQNPSVTIMLGFPSEEKKSTTETAIRFSPVKDGKVYGYTSGRNYIIEISETKFEEILLSEESIRDHEQPFRYKKEEAFQIQWKDKKTSYIVQRNLTPSEEKSKQEKKKEDLSEDSQSWHIKEPKGKKANSEEINALLNVIYNLKGKKYKQGSIGKVKTSIEIRDQSNELLFKMEVGDSYRENEEEFSWVQTSLSTDKVGIPKELLQPIYEKNPFKEEKKPEEKEAKKESENKESTDPKKP